MEIICIPTRRDAAVDTSNELVSVENQTLERGFVALERAGGVEDVKRVRDRAEAIRQYAQNAQLGLEVQNRAAELKLRAERKAGRILRAVLRRGGDRRSRSQTATLKLREIGITKHQSSRWQLVASVPEREFQQFVQAIAKAGLELTSASVLRLARQAHRQEVDRARLRRRPKRLPAGVAPASELINELICHCQLLASIVAPIYESGDAVLLSSGERRMLRRLVAEFSKLLGELHKEVLMKDARPIGLHQHRSRQAQRPSA